jgi:hypothetical protein
MEPKLSRAHPPVDLAPADWQRALRRQFGRDQAFVLENRGDQLFFSEFRVSNPQSKASYRVAIRGLNAGDNYCSCPDYATNELGTCKHIEFVLARIEKKRGAKAAFAQGWRPAFSEIYLRNDGARAVYFRAGSDCPPAVMKAASRLFGASRGGGLYGPGVQRSVATGGRAATTGTTINRGWSGDRLEDLQTIQQLRAQNEQLSRTLLRAQSELYSLKAQLDTTGRRSLDTGVHR